MTKARRPHVISGGRSPPKKQYCNFPERSKPCVHATVQNFLIKEVREKKSPFDLTSIHLQRNLSLIPLSKRHHFGRCSILRIHHIVQPDLCSKRRGGETRHNNTVLPESGPKSPHCSLKRSSSEITPEVNGALGSISPRGALSQQSDKVGTGYWHLSLNRKLWLVALLGDYLLQNGALHFDLAT